MHAHACDRKVNGRDLCFKKTRTEVPSLCPSSAGPKTSCPICCGKRQILLEVAVLQPCQMSETNEYKKQKSQTRNTINTIPSQCRKSHEFVVREIQDAKVCQTNHCIWKLRQSVVLQMQLGQHFHTRDFVGQEAQAVMTQAESRDTSHLRHIKCDIHQTNFWKRHVCCAEICFSENLAVQQPSADG